MSQSPIDIPYNRDSVVPEPSPPLSFKNYDKVDRELEQGLLYGDFLGQV